MNLRERDLSFAFLVMRLGVGITFLVYGINKFMNYSGVVGYIQDKFAETWLPGFMVAGFAHITPVAEFGLGLLVALGLFTRPALYLLGLFMLSLNFGLAVAGESDKVARNIPYIILLGIDIALLNYNRYSLDSVLFGTKK